MAKKDHGRGRPNIRLVELVIDFGMILYTEHIDIKDISVTMYKTITGDHWM